MPRTEQVRAWRPDVPGISEVFHAHFVEHVYPMHTHDAWTLLVIDEGAVRYDLDRHPHAAVASAVTLLPPGVAHDGRAATTDGFRKRVIYLDPDVIGDRWIGRSVDRPAFTDPSMRRRIDDLDVAVRRPGDELEAESRLALVARRLRQHLARVDPTDEVRRDPRVASSVRDRLDGVLDGPAPADVPRLADLAADLGVTVHHLIRSFSHEFGLPPHRYLVGRRIEQARRRLLAGQSIGDTAQATGFHDQAHLTRHFRALTGTTPGRYRRSAVD